MFSEMTDTVPDWDPTSPCCKYPWWQKDYFIASLSAIPPSSGIRKRLPLATLDDDLRKAAKCANIALLGK